MLKPADSFDSNALPASQSIVGQRGDLLLHGRQYRRHLRRGAAHIVDRESPQRDGANFKVDAPGKDIVELFGAKFVGQSELAIAASSGKSAITIKDDADVIRHRAIAHLTSKPLFVEPIEKPLHWLADSHWPASARRRSSGVRWPASTMSCRTVWARRSARAGSCSGF